jgi:glutamine amidotransferase
VAIVDYGLGNLFSVVQACEWVGLQARITASPQAIASASAVILPGVGAFGDAMAALTRLDLVSVLRDVAASTTPLVGVCLGLQLLMRESQEFGVHRGLGVIDGDVVRLEEGREGVGRLKIPHVGWNGISGAGRVGARDHTPAWVGSLLEGLPDGVFMYFVHSFYPRPSNPEAVLCRTAYGPFGFVSGIRRGNVIGLQFHPERSGPAGLRIYRNLASLIGTTKAGSEDGRKARSQVRTA